MANGPLEQILFEMGLDLTPVKNAGTAIKAVLSELNTISDGVTAKSTAAVASQSAELQKLKVLAQEAVNEAVKKVSVEQIATAELKTQTAEYQRQVAQQKVSVGLEETKRAALQVETQELVRQRAERQAETAEIALQVAELRKKRLEEDGGGAKGGIGSRLLGGVLGGGTLGKLATGALAGGAIAIGIEQAGEMVSKLIEKFKELVLESSKLTILDDVFHRMAEGAGVDADEAMKKLRESTEGLIGRVDLLKLANVGLRKEIPIDKISEMAGAIVKLAEAGGKITPEAALQAYSRYLETGRARALAMALGIDKAVTETKNLGAAVSATARQQITAANVDKEILSRAKALGEIPQTFEQAVKRQKVAVDDLMKSFGEGITSSSGMQVLISMLGIGANNLESMVAKAKEFGNTVGNWLGVIAPLISVIGSVLKDVLGIIVQISNVGLFTKVFGLDQINGAADGIEKIGKIFIYLGGVIREVLVPVKLLLETLTFIANFAIKGGATGTPGGIAQALALTAADFQELMKHYKEGDKGVQEQYKKDVADFEKSVAEARKKKSTPIQTSQKEHGDDLKEVRKHNQEVLAEIKAANAEELALKKEKIEQSREADNEEYANQNESLQAHLEFQRGLIEKEFTAQSVAKIKDFNATLQSITQRVKIGDLSGPNAELEKSKAQETLQRELVSAKTSEIKQLSALDKQANQDSRQATDLLLKDQLAQSKEALQSQQQDLETFYKNGEVSVKEYFDHRRDFILQNAQLEIAEAQRVYFSTADSEKARAEYAITMRKAVQKAQEDLNKATQQEPGALVADVGKRYAGPQASINAKQQLAQITGSFQGTDLLKESKQLLESEKQDYQDLLGLFSQGSIEWQNIVRYIDDANVKIAKITEEIRQQQDLLKGVSQIFGSIGSLVQNNLGTKFAQNLAGGVIAGAKGLTQSTKLGQQIRGGGEWYDQDGNPTSAPLGGKNNASLTDKFGDLAGRVASAASAIDSFTSSILNAKSGLAGAAGGAVGGAGLGSTIQTALGATGPWGAIAGAGAGMILGSITGSKQAKVTNDINSLNIQFKGIMNDFAQNTNNLNGTIQQLNVLINSARQMQASSKKGSSQYQSVIDQYTQQLQQLQVQQEQVLIKLHEQVAILSAPLGAQSFLNDIQQIVETYKQFEGAAQSAQDLADANTYLTQSLNNYQQNMSEQLLQNYTTAIQDALTLNDLEYQRQQAQLQYSQQIQSVLSQGVLTRQGTRAQTVGAQIYNMQQNYQRQMDQLNEQINATQFRVDGEKQIFDLATTRIGLETQLLAAQNEQTNLDLARIVALQTLLAQMASGNYNVGALGALLAAIPGVTNPAGGSNTIPGSGGGLDSLMSSLYQSRASMGFAEFRAQNL